MFKVNKRHGSLSNLQLNPERSSKLSKRKQAYKNQQTIINEMTDSHRTSRILPKLNVPQKAIKTLSQFMEIDMKKQQKNNVKQLSMGISKYYLNRAEYLKKPFPQLAYNILSVVQSFSQIENNFQQLFQFVCQDIKSFMFMTDNAELSTKYNIKEGQIYKKVVQEMDRASHKKMKDLNEKLRDMTDKKEQIQLQFNRSKQYWEDQNRKRLQEIEWYKKIANKQYMTYLEEKLKQSEQRIQELQESEKQLVRLRDEYEKQIEKLSQTIQQNTKQIARLTMILYEMKSSKGESQQLFIKLRDRFDQINFKMIGMKDVIDIVQKENQELKTQRSILSKRAAVNFQELTPRPKYNKFITFTQKQQTKKLKSTSQITEFLVKMLQKPINEDYMREQLFDQKLNSKKQYHPKLQQASHFRQTTIDSISESKQQINQVRKLMAKNSYQQ